MQSERIKHAHAIRGKLSLVLQSFPGYPDGLYCDPLRSLHEVFAFRLAVDELLQSSAEQRDRRMEAYAHDVLDLAAHLASALEPDGDESIGDIIPDLVTCTNRLCDYIAPPEPVEETADTESRPRGGRLAKAESQEKRAYLLSIVLEHPTMRDRSKELAGQVGVSESTVRRWLRDEEQKYLNSRSCQAEPGD